MRIHDPTIYTAGGYAMASYAMSSATTDSSPVAAATGAVEDELDISPAGQLASQLTSGALWGIDPGSDNAISTLDFTQARARMQSEFQTEFNQLADEQGIDRSQTFTLTSDAMGKVRVVGNHPDKEQIEAIFEENPQLANQFRGISALSSLLQAAEEAQPFQEAYAKDPYAAVAQYSHLFDDNRQIDYQMQITGDTIEDLFVGG